MCESVCMCKVGDGCWETSLGTLSVNDENRVVLLLRPVPGIWFKKFQAASKAAAEWCVGRANLTRK